jgi:sterol desaturase/sphingolipid hydroxylase (fatty acid hydroxylase superfamily)
LSPDIDLLGRAWLAKSKQEKAMNPFSLEQSRLAYRFDFALYGVASATLFTVLLAWPQGRRAESAVLAVAGLAGWSLMEYLLHRFVLHGVPPFCQWHAQHHRRPQALIGAPSLLSASLFIVCVTTPSLWLLGPWPASALTLGVIAGYLFYLIAHHAAHHWRADGAFAKDRKRRHAMHHRTAQQACCYGVTSDVWDRAFGTERSPLDDLSLRRQANL